MVGIGGTVRNLAKVDLKRSDYPLPLLHGYFLKERRLHGLIEDLAGRSMKRRANMPGLNPDRADTIVGGALVVDGVMRHVGAGKLVVSSRGLREGLALAIGSAGIPSADWVRTISVGDAGGPVRNLGSGVRRPPRRARRPSARGPRSRRPPSMREMLGHAATLLDVGRAIDYYDRFEHAAMIVTAADLGGFTHADLGALTAILRQADGDTRLGPYGRMIDPGDRDAVLKAATALTLADELNRRIPPGVAAPLSCNWLREVSRLWHPCPPGWQPRGLATRFQKVFGQQLLVVANETGSPQALTPVPPPG